MKKKVYWLIEFDLADGNGKWNNHWDYEVTEKGNVMVPINRDDARKYVKENNETGKEYGIRYRVTRLEAAR